MNDQLLQNAQRLHRAGQLTDAARLYEEVLRANPKHFEALQMLGFLHFQRRDFVAADRLMDKAIQLNPRSVDALHNRGCVLLAMDRQNDALGCFDRALALKPDYAPAQLNRGNVLSRLGRYEDALASYDMALLLMPQSVEAVLNKGNALFELKRYTEALAAYDKALAHEPGHALIWNNRGTVLRELGRHQDALASLNRALALDPAYADALANRGGVHLELNNDEAALNDFERALAVDPGSVDVLYQRARLLAQLNRNEAALAGFDALLVLDPHNVEGSIDRGVALIALNRQQEALTAFDSVLTINSRNVDALTNRANVLVHFKRYEEALESADRALKIDPGDAGAWHNRGSALGGLKRNAEAVLCYDKALAAAPDRADTWNNRGTALLALKRYEETIQCADAALAIDPANVKALGNYASALANLKRYPEAIAVAEKGLCLTPNHAPTLRALIHCRLHACDWSHRVDDEKTVASQLAAGSRAIMPLDHRAISESEEEHLQAARIWAAEECPSATTPLWRGELYRHDKIRLAYLSNDFRAHALAFLITGVYEHHDKSRFETIAISYSPDDRSEQRKRIVSAFDRFIDVQSMDDAQTAALMREMEIDIAVDVTGFTGDCRTGILAFKPAPVQVNYLGYPGTLGAPYMDYIIADRIVIPQEQRRFFSENVVYLPNSYQANDSNRRVSDRASSRADVGLPEKGFVFCCFNNTHKIGPEVFGVWMRLLDAVEDSVIWLLEDNSASQPLHSRDTKKKTLLWEAQARGIAPHRIVFAPRIAPPEHLARIGLADLFLDTRPYNAHTTGSDALWAGVPVLTCLGRSFPSRVGASLLHAIGLPELVTHSLAEYEAQALMLAREPARLAAIKTKLAANRDTFPLFDTKGFTRHLEAAFTTMWERQQNGVPPESFAVVSA